jgi:hypothetical protein
VSGNDLRMAKTCASARGSQKWEGFWAGNKQNLAMILVVSESAETIDSQSQELRNDVGKKEKKKSQAYPNP